MEGTERLTVTARLGDDSSTGWLSITDDDPAPTDLVLNLTPALLTRSGPEIPMAEGDLARSYLVSAAVPSDQGLLTSPSTVTLSLGGTASANDYSVSMLPDNTVLIPAGPVTNLGPGASPADLRVLLVITPTSDRAVEGPEQLVLSGTATGGLNVAPVSFTINDASGSTPNRITLTADRSEVEEGEGTVRLEVTARMFCDQPVACPVLAEDRTVQLEASESLSTAVAGDDFVLETGSVTIPAGSQMGSVELELQVVDDRLVEGNESVAVGGSAFGFSVNAATVLITDDEQAAGELDLRFSRGSVREGDGPAPLVLTAGWPAGLSVLTDTEVSVVLGGGSAAAGIDYELLERERFAITIPAGRSSVSAKVGELRLVDDRVSEGLETFEAFGFARAVGAVNPLRYKVNSAVLPIVDDDPARVKLTVDETYVWEGRRGEPAASETVPITVTASLTGDATGGTVVRDRDTLVRAAVGDEDDSAAAGTDYIVSGGLRNGVLPIVIPAGENSATAVFRMRVMDDNVAGETAWSAVSGPGGSRIADVSSTESVSITGAVAKGIGTDASIPVTGTKVEIWDFNDRAPTVLDLAVSPVRVTEGDTEHTARLTLTASLGVPSTASATPVCLRYNPDGGCLESYDPVIPVRPAAVVLAEDLTVPITWQTPTAALAEDSTEPVPSLVNVDSEGNLLPGWASFGTDYGTPAQVSPRPAIGQTGVVVVIPAGQLSGSTVVDLPIIGDNFTESNVLFGPSGSERLRLGADLNGWTAEPAVLEITDDDPASLQLELDKTVLEEGAGSQSVRATVRVVAPDGSAGAFPEDIPLLLRIANDKSDVEEARLSAAGLANAYHDFRLPPPPQLEDDTPVSTRGNGVNVRASGPELTEGSEVDIRLNLFFPSTSGGGGTDVTVSVGAAGDSAGSADYELVSAHFQSELTITNRQFVVNVPPGVPGVFVTLRLRVTDDALHEGAEVITISTEQGCTPPGCWGGSAQLVIPANDEPPPSDIKLVTIPAGSGSASAVFDFTVLEDVLDEGEGEDIVFEAIGAALLGSALSARLRITDNDSVSEVITLTAAPGGVGSAPAVVPPGSAPGVVREDAGNELDLNVAVSFPRGSAARLVDTVVTLSTENGSAGASDYSFRFLDPDARSPSDNGPLTDGQVVIPAGEMGVLARLGPPRADHPNTDDVDESHLGTAYFTVVDDGVAEGDETFFLKGVAEGFTVLSEMITIRDSEPEAIVLTVGSDDLRSEMELAEDVNARFADLPGGSESPLTLKVRAAFPASVEDDDLPATDTVITLGGSDGKLREYGGAVSRAASAGDYAVQSVVLNTRNTPLTLTIPANMRNAEGTIRVSLADDQIVEGTENLQITGSATGHEVSPVVIHITDNDIVLPVFDLSVSPLFAAEGAAAPVPVTVTARARGAARLGLDTVIQLALQPTEVGGPDFQPVAEADLWLTVPANAASGSVTFNLDMVDDNVAEGVTAVLDAAQLSGSAVSPFDGQKLTVAQARVVILDNDIAPSRIDLSVPTGEVREGTGTRTATVRASFPDGSPVRPVDTKVSVRIGGAAYNVEDEAGTGDYAAPPSVLVTIPAGQTSGQSSFDIRLVDDRLSEETENVTLTGRVIAPYNKPNPAFPQIGFTVSSAVLTITDNDVPPSFVTLQLAPAPPAGPAGASGASGARPFIGMVREGDGTTEFTVTASFGPGAARSKNTVLTLGLGGRQASSTALTLPDGTPLRGPDGSQVTITTPGDTAEKGNDFQIVDEDGDPITDDLTLTIPAGRTRGSAAFRLKVVDDTEVGEDPETLTVYSTAPRPANSNPRFAVMPATVTILDNDQVSEIILTLLDSSDQPLESVDEDAGTVTVKVKAAYPGTAVLGANSVITVSVNDGSAEGKGADYTPDPGEADVTIAAGDNSGTASFDLTIVDDMEQEGEETIRFDGKVAGLQTAEFTVRPAELTILDNTLPITITADVDSDATGIQTAVGEDSGTTDVTVTVSLDNNEVAPPGDWTFTLALAETDGSDKADLGTDFTLVDASGDPLSSADVTIAEGQNSASLTMRLQVTEDRNVEPNETLTISAALTDRALAFTPPILSILDNDADLTVDDDSVLEGEAETITVTAAVGAPAPAGGRTVAVSVADSSDDPAYTAAAGDYLANPSSFNITIPAGQTSATASLDLTAFAENNQAEDHKTLALTGSLTDFQVDAADLTLRDNDRGITLTVTDASDQPLTLTENGTPTTAKVTATLDAPSNALSGSVPVMVEVGAIGPGTAGRGASATDFSATSSTLSLPINTGSRTASATVDITVVNDLIAEWDEPIWFGGTADEFTFSDVHLRIDDNDSDIVVTFNKSSAREGDAGDIMQGGVSYVRFAASAAYQGATSSEMGAVQVQLNSRAVGSKPADADDYTYPSPAGIQIGAGAVQTTSARNLDVRIVDDARVDDGSGADNAETLEFYGTSSYTAHGISQTVTAASVSVSILDNDHQITLALTESGSPYTGGTEGDDLGTVSAKASFGAGLTSDRTSPTVITLLIDDVNDAADVTDNAITAEDGDVTDPASPVTITIPAAGTESGAASLTGFAFTQDTIAELRETVLAGGTADDSLPVSDVSLNILDDDSRITIDFGSTSADEADGNAGDAMATARFASTAASVEFNAATTVTLSFTLAGTASAEAADFTAPASGSEITLTIPAGSTSGTAVALTDLAILDDSRAEGTETIAVDGTAVVAGDSVGLPVDRSYLDILDSDLRFVITHSTFQNREGSRDVLPVRASFVSTTTANDLPNFTVRVSTSESDPVSARGGGADFRTLSSNLTIPAGQLNSGAFRYLPGIVIVDDTIAESNETFQLTGTTSLPSAWGATVTPINLSIRDNESITLSFGNTRALEDSNENAGGARITASFDATSSEVSAATTVTLSFGNGTATLGTGCTGSGSSRTCNGDFMAPSSAITVQIPANKIASAAKSLSGLPLVNDFFAEINETIKVTGSAGSRTVNGADLTVADKDSVVSFKFASTDDNTISVNEGDAGSGISVTAEFFYSGVKNGITQDVAVTVGFRPTWDGDALDDYTFAPATPIILTIPSGDPDVIASGSATLTGLTILDDRVTERSEILFIDGTTNASIADIIQGEMTIMDGDTGIGLSVSPKVVVEAGSSHAVTVTAGFEEVDSSTRNSSTNVTVTVASGGTGEAQLGTIGPPIVGDFDTDKTNDQFAITIPAGQVRATGTFELTAFEDDADEGAEEVKVTGAATVDGDASTPSDTLEIYDEGISLTLEDGDGDPLTTLGEASGSTQVTVKATLPDNVTANSRAVVGVNVGGGASTAGLDDDATWGTGEDFRVTYPDPKETGTPSGHALGIPIATGQASGTATFTLLINDDEAAEGTTGETILLRAGNVTVNGSSFPVTSSDSLSITDDDSGITLSFGDTKAMEDGDENAGDAEITASFSSADTSEISGLTTVTLSFADGTAASGAGNDYTAPAAGSEITVDIPANTVSSAATSLSGLALINDTVAEAEETIAVSGTAGSHTVTGTNLTVVDDDSVVTLTLTPAKLTEGSNGSGVMVAAAFPSTTTSNAIGSDTEITLSVAADGTPTTASGDDFSYSPGTPNTVTIPSAATSSSTSGALTGLTIADDAITEDLETLLVSGTPDMDVIVNSSTLTINDADDDSDIYVTVSPTTVAERTNPYEITLTTGFGGGVTSSSRSSATTVRVQIDGDGTTGKATLGAAGPPPSGDFWTDQTNNGFDIEIPAETLSATRTFRLTAREDNIDDEGAEAADVIGSATVDGESVSDTAQINIVDRVVTLSLQDGDGDPLTSFGEDSGSTQVTVKATLPAGLTADAGGEVVGVNVAAGTAALDSDSTWDAGEDFRVAYPDPKATGTPDGYAMGIAIAAGAGSGTATFTLAVNDDSAAEGVTAETILLQGSTTEVGDYMLRVPQISAGIDDDDSRIALSFGDTKASEEDGNAGDAEITATFVGATTSDIGSATTVTLSFAAGTATAGGTDFTDPSPALTVEIPANMVSSAATALSGLTLNDDTRAEGEETVAVSGSSGDFTVTSATLRIVDDNSVVHLTTASGASVPEDSDGSGVSVSAAFPDGTTHSDIGSATVITLSVSDGTAATAANDYSYGTADTVTIPANALSSSSAAVLRGLSVEPDTVTEGTETVQVGGSSTLGDAVGFDLDLDDGDTGISIAASPDEVVEGTGAQDITITASFADVVSSTRASATAVTVDITDDGTATLGAETPPSGDFFTDKTGNQFTITIPAATVSATGTFKLTAREDNDDSEAAETATVKGSATVDGNDVTATDDITILNKAITLSLEDGEGADLASLAEGSGSTQVTVKAELPTGVTADAGGEVVGVNVTAGTAVLDDGDSAWEAGEDFRIVYPAKAPGTPDGYALGIPIAAGQTSGTATFTVVVNDDAVAEGLTAETILVRGGDVTVDSSTLSALGDSLEIEDNNSVIELSFGDTKAMEDADGNAGDAMITAAFAGATSSVIGSAVTVTLSFADGTATEGTGTNNDFTNPVSAITVQIPAAAASSAAKSLSGLGIVNNTRAEVEETIAVTGTATGDYTVTGTNLAVVDDDSMITLTVSKTSFDEGETVSGVTVSAKFPDGISGSDILSDTVVTLSVAGGGSAPADSGDFTFAPASPITLTIPAQSTGSSASRALTGLVISEDDVTEDQETVLVGGTANVAVVVNPTTLTLNDADNDIEIAVSPTTVAERNDPYDVTVTAGFAGVDMSTRTSPTSVTVEVRAGDTDGATRGAIGPPASGDFYTDQSGDRITVTIPAGSDEATGTFKLTARQDGDHTEGTETIAVSGRASVDGETTRDSADMNLVQTGIELSVVDADTTETGTQTELSEGAGTTGVRVRAALKSGLPAGSGAVTVSVTVTTHYTDASNNPVTATGTVTIADGSTSGTGDISVTVQDNNVIGSATETWQITATANEGYNVDGTTVSVIDDDATQIVLVVTPGAVDEGTSGQSVSVKARLRDSATSTSNAAVTVSLGGTGTTATSGSDFDNVSPASRSLTIAAGDSESGTETFTLDILDDDVTEGPEEIAVRGDAGATATVTPFMLTINDADNDIEISVSPTTVAEREDAYQVTVTAEFAGVDTSTRGSATSVTVDITDDGTATLGSETPTPSGDFWTDKTNDTFSIEIPAQATSHTGTFDLTARNDGDNTEGAETVAVSGSATVDGETTMDSADISLVQHGIELSVVDADTTESGTQTELSEGAGSTSLRIQAALKSGIPAGSGEVTVNVTVTTHYTAGGQPVTETGTVTIADGSTSGTGDISVTVQDDNVAGEGDGTWQITATADEGYTVDGTTVEVADDETAPTEIQLSINPASVNEGVTDNQTITVTAGFPSGSDVLSTGTTVSITVGGTSGATVADLNDDYTVNRDSFDITIGAGSSSGTNTFTVNTVNDTDTEGNERIAIRGSATGFSVTAASLTINDTSRSTTPPPTTPPTPPPTTPPTPPPTPPPPTPPPSPPPSPPPTQPPGGDGGTPPPAPPGGDGGTPPPDGGDGGTPPPDGGDGTTPPPPEPPDGGDDGGDGQDSEGGEIPADGEGGEDGEAGSAGGTGGGGGGSAGSRCDGRFCDDDASVHEPNIEKMAEWEITLGCDADNPSLFCPSQTIQRRQMAAFLHRAHTFRFGEPPAPEGVELSDVSPTVWYRPFAEWVVSVGAFAAPQGVFRPRGVVTRADMAVMMIGAFPHLLAVEESQDLFTDVGDLPEETVLAIEGLYAAGITLGCTTSAPLRFCPEREVTRAQMASFFVRALNIGVELSFADESGAALTALEEDSGTTQVTVTASLPTGVVAPSAGLTVGVNVLEGTARLDTGLHFTDEDFRVSFPFDASPPDGFSLGIDIPAGQSSGSAVFTVVVNDDEVAERAVPETIKLRGGSVTVNRRPFPVLETFLDITDDDSAISLTISSRAREQDGHAGAARITARFASADSSEIRAGIRVVLAFAAGSRAESSDFTAPRRFLNLIIPAGETASPALALNGLAVRNDAIAEGPEVVAVSGRAGDYRVIPAGLTITDDDSQVALTLSPASLAEGGDGSAVSVSAAFPSGTTSSEIGSDTVIVLSAADGTASPDDYAYAPSSPNTVTIPAGETSSSTAGRLAGLTVVADGDDEGSETIMVGGSSPLGSVPPVTLTVTDEAGAPVVCSGRFCDEDGSVHEASIERLVEWEITLGCDADDPTVFCPSETIQRRQMAAFLHRAVTFRWGAPEAPTGVALSDVPEDAWYRPFAEWVVSVGAFSAPQGAFNPTGPVTRADMAVMMVAAFPHLSAVETPQNRFADVSGLSEDEIRAVEGLYEAEVTLGCTTTEPLRFCPDNEVTRAQMASFFVRALNQATPTTP